MKQNIFFVIVLLFFLNHPITASQRQRIQEAAEQIAMLRTQLKEKYLEKLDELRRNFKKAYIREAKRILGVATKKEIDEMPRETFASRRNEILQNTNKRKYELLEDFINKNVNNNTINIQDQNGKTILFDTIASGFEDLVSELLNKGADITITTLLGNTMLHQATAVNSRMTNLILQKASQLEHEHEFINQTNKFGNSALILAIDRNDADTVRALLKAGASPNIVNNDGFTPLHQAILQEKPSKKTVMIVKLLLESGANPGAEVESKLISGKKRYNKSPMELVKRAIDDISATESHANPERESIRYTNLEKMYEAMLAYTGKPFQIIKKTAKKRVRIEDNTLSNALRKLIIQLETLKGKLTRGV